jgi:hypothetical protein
MNDKPASTTPVNPWAEALDAVWAELTAEQIANLTPDVAALCRANHEALWHDDIPWDHPHRFADVKPPAEARGRYVVSAPTSAYEPLIFANAEALRDHLHALNEAGEHPVAVGIDSTPLRGAPFLITLVGPYAEGEDVLFDSPWQGDIDWQIPPRCDECTGTAHSMEHLRFPVTVMIAKPEGGAP